LARQKKKHTVENPKSQLQKKRLRENESVFFSAAVADLIPLSRQMRLGDLGLGNLDCFFWLNYSSIFRYVFSKLYTF